MAAEEVRSGVYEAIRGLMGRNITEPQFRRKLEALGVPMTAGLPLLFLSVSLQHVLLCLFFESCQ